MGQYSTARLTIFLAIRFYPCTLSFLCHILIFIERRSKKNKFKNPSAAALKIILLFASRDIKIKKYVWIYVGDLDIDRATV
jgi:hypothetical protein